jgi:hypothetical protein
MKEFKEFNGRTLAIGSIESLFPYNAIPLLTLNSLNS